MKCIGCSIIGTESLSLFSNLANTVLLLECGQPSYTGIELTLQPQSFLKKLGVLYTHETRDLCSFHSLLVEPLKEGNIHLFVWRLFLLLQLEGPAPLPLSLANSISTILSFFMSLVLHSKIFQLTQAFILLSVNFSCIFQPFSLGSTSVNYYICLTHTQYRITELIVRH